MALVVSRHALLALALCGACVEPPPPASIDDNPLVDRLGCLGQTPACLEGCRTRDVLAGASCEEGTWRCPDGGVREDLCCDPLANPGSCPDWGDACGGGAACPSGYSCVRSRAFPVPYQGDAGDGICRLGEWSMAGFDACTGEQPLLWPEALLDRGGGPIQVGGIVSADPSCEDHTCPPDDACCQRCTGSYTLAMMTSDGQPLEVPLRTETVACAGTNCGYSCSPLQPGRRYRVWGLWDPDAPRPSGGRGAILYAGHCDD